MDTTTIISSGAIAALIVAAITLTERYIYYRIGKKATRRATAFSEIDKLLNDFDELKTGLSCETTEETERMGSVSKRVKNTKQGLNVFEDTHQFILKPHTWIDSDGKICTSPEYEDSFKTMENRLNHYFTFLCNIIRCIEEQKNFDSGDKTFYINRLKWSLSTIELFTLFCFCISENNLPKQLKLYVEKYSLFENMASYLTEEIKSEMGNYRKFYKPSIFSPD